MTTNIIRQPLVDYTVSCANYYGIPLRKGLDSGPIWDPSAHRWRQIRVSLPTTPMGKLIFVPRSLVRRNLTLNHQDYFGKFLLPALQIEELQKPGSPLVEVMARGRRRVTKKSLMERYGANKEASARETIPRPAVLSGYSQRRHRTNPPMETDDFPSSPTASPDFSALLSTIQVIPPGQADATDYHHAVERLLTALFAPNLCFPQREFPRHDGRKRIDIDYTNMRISGFFRWVGEHHPSGRIPVECKNYSRDVANPGLDQLAGRFSVTRGVVGILASRSFTNKKQFLRRCRDTARDGRGFIIALDDADLAELVSEATDEDTRSATSVGGLLSRRFGRLVD